MAVIRQGKNTVSYTHLDVYKRQALYYHYFYNPASMVHKYDPKMAEGIRELNRTIRIILEAKKVENGKTQQERESIYLTMLSVKNELRGGKKGYAGRIAELCRREHVGDSLKRYDIRAQERANRMMLWIMTVSYTHLSFPHGRERV